MSWKKIAKIAGIAAGVIGGGILFGPAIAAAGAGAAGSGVGLGTAATVGAGALTAKGMLDQKKAGNQMKKLQQTQYNEMMAGAALQRQATEKQMAALNQIQKRTGRQRGAGGDATKTILTPLGLSGSGFLGG